MHGGGARGDVEPLGETRVAEALGQERRHLPLARRELGGPGRLAPDAQPALDGDQLVDPPPAPPAQQRGRRLGVGERLVQSTQPDEAAGGADVGGGPVARAAA